MDKALYGKGRNSTHIIKELTGDFGSGTSYCGQYINFKNISEYKSAFDVCQKCIKIKEKYEMK